MILDGILVQGFFAGHAQASADASQLVDRAIEQVRTISHLLHPPLLDEVGLSRRFAGIWKDSRTQRNRNPPGSYPAGSQPA